MKAAAPVVLVAGDNSEDAGDVLRQLSAEFEQVGVSAQPDLWAADFERLRPRVVVLAFKELDTAQAYCRAVLPEHAGPGGAACRTVVLCGRDDVRAAFELCKRESFDDYVLYWPQPYDGLRLAMSVLSACRHLPAEPVTVASPDALPASGAAAEPARQPSAALVASARAAGQPRPLVLVVEDDAFASKLIAKALEPQPWQLAFAGDADQAIALLRERRPSVILMDVNLPGMDGVALTERLKSTPAHADIPVLMLTGEARRETLDRSRLAGAAGFIVKPFTREGLVAKLLPFLA